MEFNVHQAKAQFSKLLDLAQEGEEVLIVRNGKPVAELIPARRKGALTLGAERGTLLTKGDDWWKTHGVIAVSVASYWEMINKKGRVTAPIAEPASWAAIRHPAEIPMFPIRFEHVARLETMEWPHPDPYDRILCARALVEGAKLITADRTIRANRAVPTLGRSRSRTSLSTSVRWGRLYRSRR